MCGIAGLVSTDRSNSITEDMVRRMCDQIIYRGPDDEGLYVEGHVGLGMRRLAIIDVSGGRQPIFNEDRSIVTVFNGEIYNFLELRQELIAKGHTFTTKTDTEVIVHLYEEHGCHLVDKLRGMFAFALYDKHQDKLLLARDRLGKKPLHYAVYRDVLYFGSEIKSLLAVLPQLAEVDLCAIAQFFYYGYILDPATVFKTVRKLPPGHLLEFNKSNVRIEQYWDVPQFASADPPEEECLQQMESILEEAVRMRLISDVPLGALLSGGVDSSVVVAMMARLSNARVKTFTIGFSHSDFNEAPHARAVAEAFHTDHHELVVDADLWDTTQKLTTIMDEPFADSSLIPTFLISQLARRHVTVALSGDGGDELFAGYPHYQVYYRRRHLDHIPKPVKRFFDAFIRPLLPRHIGDRKLVRNFGLKTRDRYIDGTSLISFRTEGEGLLSDDFLYAIAESHPRAVAEHYFDNAPASDLLSRMQYTDIKTYLTADILTKVDRASMAASLEMRAPLLDHLFVELAVSFPLKTKLRGHTRKYLLLKLAERLGIPKKVLYRPKQGFSLPLMHWMRGELKDEITSLLLEPMTLQRGYFRKKAVEQILQEHSRGRRDYSAIIWQLLVFELWHRNFFGRFTTAGLTTMRGNV